MSDRDWNDWPEGRFSERDEGPRDPRREWEQRTRDGDRSAERYPRPQSHELRSQGRGFRDEDYGHSRYLNESSQREPSYTRQGAYTGPTGSYSGYRDERDGDRARFQGQTHQDWGRDSAQQGTYVDRSSYGRGSSHDQGRTFGSSFGSSYGDPYGGSSRDASSSRQGGSSWGNAPSYERSNNSAYSQGAGGAGQGHALDRRFSEGNFWAPESGRNYAQSSYAQGGYGASQGARSYEIEGARGEYRGRHEDSFGQQLRDGAQAVVRNVKRVFRGPKGYKRSDERIREDVSDRLAAQDQVDPSEIEVQVQNGEVTLTGTVQSRHEKFLAEELADDVSGVNDVHNQLRVRRDNQAQSTSSSSTTQSGTQSESARSVRNGHA